MNEGLSGYGGRLNRCSGCDRSFVHREIIRIDLVARIAFCNDTWEKCVDLWKKKIGQSEAVYQLHERRYHGNT